MDPDVTLCSAYLALIAATRAACLPGPAALHPCCWQANPLESFQQWAEHYGKKYKTVAEHDMRLNIVSGGAACTFSVSHSIHVLLTLF